MLSGKETVQISKFLSLVLRHRPEEIGLVLDEGGWAGVETLLDKMQRKGFGINREDLLRIVHTNNKKRFAFSEDGQRIRASQGHSLNVELGYQPQQPPEVLFHGTAEKNLASILAEGLKRRNRQHVHLSTSVQTALQVGGRHGKPALLRVAAAAMYNEGCAFFLSANGVWLTDEVPPQYLFLLDQESGDKP